MFYNSDFMEDLFFFIFFDRVLLVLWIKDELDFNSVLDFFIKYVEFGERYLWMVIISLLIDILVF